MTQANLNVLQNIISKQSGNSGYAKGVFSLITDTTIKHTVDEEYKNKTVCESGGGQNNPEIGRINSNYPESKPKSNIGEILAIPNPATNEFFIDFSEPATGKISVHDLVGKQIFNKQVSNSKKIEISTQNWTSGIYFIHFRSTLGKVQTAKIIVNKE